MILGIYGASGLGAEFEDTAEKINSIEHRWDDIVFVDDDDEKIGTQLVGKKVISYEEIVDNYGISNIEFIIGIGEPNVKDVVFNKLDQEKCNIINLYFPGTSIGKDSQIGRGVVVQDISSIPPMSKIGNCVVIQGKTAIGHSVIFGDNVVISSFAFVGGDTTIGKGTYIAPHSCIKNGIHIGENCVIGMGSVVTKDIPDNVIAYGNPCEIKRFNENGRVFSK